jgi:hypothetical protein
VVSRTLRLNCIPHWLLAAGSLLCLSAQLLQEIWSEINNLTPRRLVYSKTQSGAELVQAPVLLFEQENRRT